MKKLLKTAVLLCLAAALLVFGTSSAVVWKTRGSIAAAYRGEALSDAVLADCAALGPQCILVPGCAVWSGNRPSPMLQDRLDCAIALYRQGAAPKLLFSGDNGDPAYSEPDCMLAYALEQGVPAEDIFLDFAGFSTYDTVVRAKEVFGASRVLVVTQTYHLFRTLQICDSMEIEALGVAAEQRRYVGGAYREAREVFARGKDLIKSALKLPPRYLGDPYELAGDGRATHLN